MLQVLRFLECFSERLVLGINAGRFVSEGRCPIRRWRAGILVVIPFIRVYQTAVKLSALKGELRVWNSSDLFYTIWNWRWNRSCSCKNEYGDVELLGIVAWVRHMDIWGCSINRLYVMKGLVKGRTLLYFLNFTMCNLSHLWCIYFEDQDRLHHWANYILNMNEELPSIRRSVKLTIEWFCAMLMQDGGA